MELALIPPLAQVGASRWTKYQMLLPHMLEHEKYRKNYFRRRHEGSYMILDNGAADAGLTHWTELMAYAREMMVNEIVLPDAIGEWEITTDLIRERLHKNLPPQFKYMAVLQGHSLAEVRTMAGELVEELNPKQFTFGIPRHLLSVGDSARIEVVDYLRKAQGWKGDIHLLGMHREHPFEIMNYRTAFENMGVRGVDTRQPFLYAMYNEYMVEGRVLNDLGGDYFDANLQNNEHLWSNLVTMRTWVKGELG